MNTDTDLHDDLREILIENGFCPLEDADTLHAEWEVSQREANVLAYFGGRGWDAWRLEAGKTADLLAGFTLVRWSEDGIDLMEIDPNGCINAEARFNFNAKGIAWLAGAVTE